MKKVLKFRSEIGGEFGQVQNILFQKDSFFSYELHFWVPSFVYTGDSHCCYNYLGSFANTNYICFPKAKERTGEVTALTLGPWTAKYCQ